MYIICKEKDYYDYVGYTNETENITFDRRNMKVYKRGTETFDYSSFGSFINSVLGDRDEEYLFLWIGYHIYVFKIKASGTRYEYTKYNKILSSKFNWEVELVDKRICYDVKHNFPIEFMIRRYRRGWYSQAQLEKEIKESSVSNWEIERFDNDPFEKDYKVPILKETFVPSFVSAEEAYYAIEEWLISQHNDVNQESRGLTDTDKIVNHGFDKKISFRNVNYRHHK